MNILAADLDQILHHTRDLWEEVRHQRIFITGGTGFFGCWLLESFAWANEKLKLEASATVLTRDPAAFRKKVPHLAASPCVRLHAGDVRTFDFPAGDFPLVIHAATPSSGVSNPAAPSEMLDAIATGTRRTLEFAVAHGARRFLLTSSGAVYGTPSRNPTAIAEDCSAAPDCTSPSSAIGEGKRVAELLCAICHQEHGLETKIARAFTFIGPYLPLGTVFAMGNFIRDALHGGPIEVKGDGSPLRSYLYAADLAIWLWTILLRGKPVRAYNVGSEHALSIREAAQLVADVVAPETSVHIGRQATHEPRPHYVCNTQRARTELGLRQRVTLADAIRRTAEWHHRAARPEI